MATIFNYIYIQSKKIFPLYTNIINLYDFLNIFLNFFLP